MLRIIKSDTIIEEHTTDVPLYSTEFYRVSVPQAANQMPLLGTVPRQTRLWIR